MRLIDADAEIAKINQEIQRALAQIKEWEDNREDRGGYHNVDAKIERLKGNINLARAEIACLESYNTAYDVDKVVKQLKNEKQTSASARAEVIIGMCGASANHYGGEECAYEKAIKIAKAGGANE